MRINWFSNAPWGPSGYSQQTNLFVPRLQNLGHDMSITAFWGLQGGRLEWGGPRGPIPCFPGLFDPHGQDIMGFYAQQFQADILITLYDTWVMNLDNPLMQGVRFVPWFPVDHDTMPDAVYEKIKRAFHAIAYSHSGVEAAKDRGLEADYVPHGVDTEIFKPKMRQLARKQLGIPQDCFLVSIVAMNKGIPPRKAWPQQLEAFARFYKTHPDARLYLHTLMTPEIGGYNLWELVNALGLEKAVIVPEQIQYVVGFPPPWIADIYNATDVLMSATMGEGFGLPIIEAQACGTPVIVGGWTAMDELLHAGWKLDKETEAVPYYTQLNARQFIPSVTALVDKLEQAYDMPNADREALRIKAHEAMKPYDANYVTEHHWVPTLQRIQEKIDSGAGPTTPLKRNTGPNRAARRAAAKSKAKAKA